MTRHRSWIAAALVAACSQPADRPATPPTDVAVTPAAQAQSQAQPDDPRGSRSRGAASAPITVYEMSDFQCPFCRRHALETMPVLEREYIETGKVRWVFINLPIPDLHRNAIPAAELALCAAQQGKFWEAHHLLFEHQGAWGPLANARPYFLSLADSMKLDRAKTIACVQDTSITRAVREEAESAVRAGATSTPTFYIEGGLLIGAHPPGVFRQILDSLYKEKAIGR